MNSRKKEAWRIPKKEEAVKVNGRIRERNGIYHAVMYWYIGEKQHTRSFSTKIKVKGRAEEKEAERMLAVAMSEFVPTQANKAMTMDLYIEDYLELVVEKYIVFRGVAPSTELNVRNSVKRMNGFFRGKKIVTKELSKSNVDDFIFYCLREKKFKSSTTRLLFSLFKALIEISIEEDLFLAQTFRRLFSKKYKFPSKKKEFKVLYSKDLESFFDSLKGHPFELELSLLLAYGIRKGELLGLTFSRISFEEKKIDIFESLVLNKKRNEYYVNKYLKTEQSRRTLPLFEHIEFLLKERLVRIEEDIAFFKKKYNKKWEGYLCVDKQGKILSYGRLNYALKTFCQKYNFISLTPHGLRHSFGTAMSREGMDIYDLKTWLGHSKIETTNHYVHFDNTKNKVLIEQIEIGMRLKK